MFELRIFYVGFEVSQDLPICFMVEGQLGGFLLVAQKQRSN